MSNIGKIRSIFHRHEWETITPGDTDFENAGEIQVCVKCRKRRQYYVHCLGLNPPAYVKEWVLI